MAQQMCTFERWIQPGSLQRSTHDRTDPLAVGESTARRSHPDKDAPRRHRWSALTDVGGQRLADLMGQRQAIVACSLAADKEFPGFPLEIIEAQGHHFPGP